MCEYFGHKKIILHENGYVHPINHKNLWTTRFEIAPKKTKILRFLYFCQRIICNLNYYGKKLFVFMKNNLRDNIWKYLFLKDSIFAKSPYIHTLDQNLGLRLKSWDFFNGYVNRSNYLYYFKELIFC